MKIDLTEAKTGDVYLDTLGRTYVFMERTDGSDFPYRFYQPHDIANTATFNVQGKYYSYPVDEDLVSKQKPTNPTVKAGDYIKITKTEENEYYHEGDIGLVLESHEHDTHFVDFAGNGDVYGDGNWWLKRGDTYELVDTQERIEKPIKGDKAVRLWTTKNLTEYLLAGNYLYTANGTPLYFSNEMFWFNQSPLDFAKVRDLPLTVEKPKSKAAYEDGIPAYVWDVFSKKHKTKVIGFTAGATYPFKDEEGILWKYAEFI